MSAAADRLRDIAQGKPVGPRPTDDAKIADGVLKDLLDFIFATAVAGDRCPDADLMPFKSRDISAAARLGHIRVEIWSLNWRVIEIRKGPRTGVRTQNPPLLTNRHGKKYQRKLMRITEGV
jgi:hypothetical protein